MNPDSAVVIEDALVIMAHTLNIVTDKEPSVTHSNNQDNFDETSVYEETEYMVPFKENTKFWQSTWESDKSELNMTQMILTLFFSKITYDKDSNEFRYIATRDYVRLWDN